MTRIHSAGPARRQRLLLVVAITAALLSTGGLAASTFVRSPQQVLAETAAPLPSLITAPVERRVLASTIVTRGTVVAGSQIEVTPVQVDAAVQVVTAVRVAPGDEIRPGDVMLAVSGRPLIVLGGELPAYRDLRPGDSGDDVAQLQAALAELGHYHSGDRTGYFGWATKQAVRELYTAIGYEPADTGGPGGRGDRDALAAADEAVASAQRDVDAMSRRISAGEEAGPAEEPLADQLDRLEQQRDAAVAARSDLVAHTGTMLPLAEFVFVPEFPARVASASARVGGPVEPPLLVIASGELVVEARLRGEQATLVRPGMPVQLVSELLGKEASATVSSVGELTTDELGSASHPVLVTAEEELPAAWAGSDVRVTITSAATEDEVLVVPLSAVSAGADGTTTVSLVDDAGRGVRRVPVQAGVSGDGFVEVTPVDGAALAEGDMVVVGQQWSR